MAPRATTWVLQFNTITAGVPGSSPLPLNVSPTLSSGSRSTYRYPAAIRMPWSPLLFMTSLPQRNRYRPRRRCPVPHCSPMSFPRPRSSVPSSQFLSLPTLQPLLRCLLPVPSPNVRGCPSFPLHPLQRLPLVLRVVRREYCVSVTLN